MRAWEIVSADGIDALHLADRPPSQPGPGEVLVRMRASSVNYRDLMTIRDPESRAIPYPRIPNSDGAGEVLAIGPGVTSFAPGDRVAGTFFQSWDDGPISADAMASALGGAQDGVLAEQVVLAHQGLVRVPAHLSFEEAATLPCAALTAWHALIEKGGLKAGETVLVLGTGGVSIFALQFAALHGARPIVISSSDAKLERRGVWVRGRRSTTVPGRIGTARSWTSPTVMESTTSWRSAAQAPSSARSRPAASPATSR